MIHSSVKLILCRSRFALKNNPRFTSHTQHVCNAPTKITIERREFDIDAFTNVTPRILSHLGRKLHLEPKHPLNFLRQRIVNYLHSKYITRTGSPQFSEYSHISPVVALSDNFDSLMVPENHPSRKPTDSYYINKEYMLRAHMTAHDSGLINSGLDNFVLIGDVYRRDEIDKSHYPVFHQVDAVRLRTEQEIFMKVKNKHLLKIFDDSTRNETKQERHTLEAVKLMEFELKTCVVGLIEHLFGKGFRYRWIEAYFPFTHPSWELEIDVNGEWLEVVGCGILEQNILEHAGAGYKIGWAFGLGLERIAMQVYNIPDIRLFWSQDSGFLSQFNVQDIYQKISFKPVSSHPQCMKDVSFWIPEAFEANNFFELVRNFGGDLVEQISLLDKFVHPKTKQTSHCYRIIYRHMEKALTNEEINALHNDIREAVVKELQVILR